MKIDIKNLDGVVIYSHECECNTICKTVEAAVMDRANLYRANLSKANLSKANISGANLPEADISGANLSGANLSGAVVLGDIIQKSPVSVCNLHWSALITEHKMQIGCQTHTHEEWASFEDETIIEIGRAHV